MLKTKLHIKSLRIPFIIIADILLITLSFFVTYSFVSQYDKEIHEYFDIIFSVVVYNLVTGLTLISFGSYRRKILDRITDTVFSVLGSVVVSQTVCALIFMLPVFKIKLGIGMIISTAITLVLVLICHVAQNQFKNYYLKKLSVSAEGIPTLIVGAGFTGKMVYNEIISDVNSGLVPICFVDDNKDIIATKVCGLNVYGPIMLFLPELCKKHNIGMIVFAIPSCPAEQKARILSICNSTGCDIRIIPSVGELQRGAAFFKQARTINVEQLLGRDTISFENEHISKILHNKVCLVTGGGGSIGSELCRQIVLLRPEKVVIVDIYENNAYDIQQELVRQGFGDKIYVEIASVRDKNKMELIFKKYKFDVIFHAAAHKHVPLMETNPEEAVKNNVVGTYNIAHLAHKYGVGKMVLISTDKAVNPTNVMGASKRVCEMVMQYMAQSYPNTMYTSVRFGNVLGSNGSVIPLFTKQIEAGGPVTVTHPEIIRYFMTIPEAVSLVLEAATMSVGGETFVLDMGQPVKIVTLAENLIRMYGFEPYKDMKIEFCGLRHGEKLYEELLLSTENLKETHNKKIFIMDQQNIDTVEFKDSMQKLLDVASKNNSEKTVETLHSIVPEFKTPEEVNGIK